MQEEFIVKKESKTFRVTDAKTNMEVDGAFVLMPEKDSAARVALAAYGEATNKPRIARWIRDWLRDIHRKRRERKERVRDDNFDRH